MAEDVTALLNLVRKGDKEAESHLVELVYNELRVIASRYLRRERAGHTLQTTALVNEAYMRLAAPRETDWNNRAHFFGAASQVMRHILVDYARNRLAGRRGGGGDLFDAQTSVETHHHHTDGSRIVALQPLHRIIQDEQIFQPIIGKGERLIQWDGLKLSRCCGFERCGA